MSFSLRIESDLARRIGTLALPVITAMLMQTALNQVDHILVGRLPKEEATPGQAALQVSLALLWLVGGFLSSISVGTQAMAARRFGAGTPLEAGRVWTNSVAVATVSSIIAAIVSWFAVPYVFPLVNKNPDVLRLGVPYLQWRMLGVISMVMTASCKSWFDGLGNTRIHMYAAIAMNIANALLAYGLIFGELGMPRMGVEGCGIASMTSSFVGLAIMVAFVLAPDVRRQYRLLALTNLDRRMAWELVKLSIPSGLATLFVMTGFLFFYAIVAHLDIKAGHKSPLFATATSNIVTILQLTFMTCLAYGTATATLVSQSMGAKRFDLAERYVWEAVKIGVYFFAAVSILVVLFPEQVLWCFTKDADVIATAVPALRLTAAGQPVIVAAIVLTQALFGAGNTFFVMCVELVLHFTCMVPLAYLFGVVLGWSIVGVFASANVYIFVLMLVMGWKFRSGSWKSIEI